MLVLFFAIFIQQENQARWNEEEEECGWGVERVYRIVVKQEHNIVSWFTKVYNVIYL